MLYLVSLVVVGSFRLVAALIRYQVSPSAYTGSPEQA